MSDAHEVSAETTVVTAGRPPRTPGAPLNTPIAAASSFIGGGDISYGYARDSGPTSAALEDALGQLEGGTATVFASGQAATAAIFDLVPAGGIVVAPDAMYNGTLSRLGELEGAGKVIPRPVDIADTAAVLAALGDDETGRASLVWLEVATNPLLDVVDLPTVIAAAHAAGALVAVDNTFATPLLLQPLDLGADFSMHSVTKLIAGHSDMLGGAVITRDAQLAEQVHKRRLMLGAVPSAFDCFLALRGLRTLALRLERAQSTAKRLVQELQGHPAVSKVRYPGFGTILAIEVADAATADAVCAATTIWTAATSVGGAESLIERRAQYAAESARVPASLIRLSVGIEHPDDLSADLHAALAAAGA